MIPRSRVSGRLLIGRSAARTVPSSTSTRAVAGFPAVAHYTQQHACARRLQPAPACTAAQHRIPALYFSTSAFLGKEKDKPSKFFDPSAEPESTEPLSEEEVKANLENKKKEAISAEKAANESKDSDADATVSAKSDNSASQAQENKAGSSAGGAAGAGSGDGSGDGGKRGRKSSEKALQKPVVPDVYPQVLAIPIARRPLFPGFYKAITIKDPDVATAITETRIKMRM
ncbi:uncharacterized protein LMH87_008722 [Akanthomyces muscarius]|uniref:Uncharacterized protein n=1 Tax=Akanthomyces muscarius TaxID=2231603 RepID=A0A9W8QHT8_AKAMU|nr:uncharacterized protein LMH87_008722 [Akanthomyces muscarius]KAJ4158186.1 hypothetical protein LMH87_008722 [Akanthomyces muscarius]